MLPQTTTNIISTRYKLNKPALALYSRVTECIIIVVKQNVSQGKLK